MLQCRYDGIDVCVDARIKELIEMINFEEELKKFHPSLEIEDAEEAIYNQDLTDMADLLVKMVQESRDKEEE